MSRREFWLVLAGLLVAAPSLAIAQSSAAVRRIGFLDSSPPDTPEQMREDAAKLRELGWVEGQNLLIERRYANGRLDALPSLAGELVRARVEVIVANGPNPTRAAMRATTMIPIVFRVASDPVRSGLVVNLARPGGNVTGFSASSTEAYAKMLSLLKELLPTLRRLGVLEVAGNPEYGFFREQFERDCQTAGIEPVFVELASPSQIESSIARLARERAQILLLLDDSFTGAHGAEIIATALQRSLPTTSENSRFAQDGALITHSASEAEATRRWASYVDRILRGAKPADLPVEQPTQFDLVINLKTAKALGITIPESLLLRANEVIR